MEGSGENAGDQAPVKNEAGQTIGVVVRDQQGTEVHFKIKPSTKFEKVFKAYCDKKSLDLNTVKFLFDGNRVQPQNTPEQLAVEDGDCLDCMIEQIGGKR